MTASAWFFVGSFKFIVCWTTWSWRKWSPVSSLVIEELYLQFSLDQSKQVCATWCCLYCWCLSEHESNTNNDLFHLDPILLTLSTGFMKSSLVLHQRTMAAHSLRRSTRLQAKKQDYSTTPPFELWEKIGKRLPSCRDILNQNIVMTTIAQVCCS